VFSVHLKVKVVESLISSGVEDHTFGPINLREHFPEEELTLSKNYSHGIQSWKFLQEIRKCSVSWCQMSSANKSNVAFF